MPQFAAGNEFRFGAGQTRKPPVKVSAEAEEFVALLGKTSTLDKKLKASLRKRVREAGKAGAKAVQDEVQKPPLHSGRGERMEGVPQSRGLRRNIAAGVGSSVATTQPGTAGVNIRASGKALPPNQKTLLKKYNRERGWRHPGIGTARRVSSAKSGAQTLRAMGAAGAASDLTSIARNTGRWYEQKGRPYFGKVLAARKDELGKAVTDAVQDARKAAGLP